MHDREWPSWAADMSLLFVTAVWGTTFVIVKNAISHMSPMYFLALRFTLASLVLAVLPGTTRGLMNGWRRTVLPGTLLALAYMLQTYGLLFTTASRAGFITGLSVILVPIILSLAERRAPSPVIMAGATISTIGLAIMSGGSGGPLNMGDLLVLGCAFGFALQIVFVGRRAGDLPSLSLTTGMLATASVLFWPLALHELFYHGAAALPNSSALTAIFVTALLATSLAFYLQCKMQRFTTPSHTALIFSAEPVFAALFAYILADERIGAAGFTGGGLIVLGILLVELIPMVRQNAARGIG